jgi:hemolysin activation/secretion protein
MKNNDRPVGNRTYRPHTRRACGSGKRMARVVIAMAAAAFAACAMTVPAHAAEAASAAARDNTGIYFDISRFDVRGNTLLPPQTVEALLAPYTGAHREFADVTDAVEALTAAYRARGYQLVNVALPEQELDRGIVVLNVVESRIGRVKIEGNRHFDDANIRNSLPGLSEGKIPDISAISKSLKLANENPAKKTILSMQNGAQPDEVDPTLAVTDDSPWSASLNLDNSGTAQTGRTHASFAVQNANLFGLDHVLNLQYTTTVEKPNQVSVYGAGYHVPLYALGDSLDFFGSYSNVDAGTVTAGILDIAVSGKGTVYGARYNHNLAAAGRYESKIVYGLDYKAYKNSVQLLGVDVGNDVTVHPASVGYQVNWSGEKSTAGFALTLLHNITGGSRGSQTDFANARADARADYTMLRFSANATRTLPQDWLVRAVVNGQYTNDALVPGEQFGAGGASSVRGFDEREISNDSGVVGNLEMYSPQLCRNENWQCRVLGFYDMAHATRNHALPGEFTDITISSIGAGMRFAFRKNIDLQLDWGHVLRAQATVTQRGDNRLHARLGLTF